MKQWWVVPGEHGAVLELRQVEVPAPGPGEVLVRMAGAGVNRGELIGGRLLRTDNPRARPAPSGIEIGGTVEAVGADVEGWSPGDRVMARGTACHAELAVVPAAAVMASPAGLDDVAAAAIPNVFVTAHDAIVTAAEVTADDTVLITAGSSGVGTAAIQIARHLGATTIATTPIPGQGIGPDRARRRSRGRHHHRRLGQGHGRAHRARHLRDRSGRRRPLSPPGGGARCAGGAM